MNTKNKMIAVLMAAIMVSAAVMPTVMAQSIPTTGVVNGGASPPTVEHKWELPDDDDEPNHLTPGTQVLPEADGIKVVEFYMLASDPNGVGDIQNAGFRVAHPTAPDDGIECWMPIPWPGIYNYGDVQNFKLDEGTAHEWVWPADQVEIEDAFDRAITANFFTYDQVYGAEGLTYQLDQNAIRFFYAYKDFTCCYAPGIYEIKAWASDSSGAEGALINNLEYAGIKSITLDFDQGLDYGELVPAIKKRIQGDVDMGTPDAPTVHSGANAPIQIWLRATPMIGIEKHDPINAFDARLNQYAELEFLANTDVAVPGVLIPNWEEKMDFSVTPPWGTPEDIYVGTMNLWIEDYFCPE